MKNGNELVVIFKTKITETQVLYKPISVVSGIYDNESQTFIDDAGRKYKHIINLPEDYGFACRYDIANYRKRYPILPLSLIKHLVLNSTNRFTYEFILDIDTNVPVIIIKGKKDHNTNIFFDTDLILYYGESYPDFLSNVLDISIETNDNKSKSNKKANDDFINIDISRLYSEITDYVIGQDEPIKKILTAIWKQYNNFSGNKSRNIFINGSTGVGKTEIFRVLSKIINVPVVITSATEYSATGYIGRSVSDMLVSLLERANGDIEKAQKGILIIDEIDKLAVSENMSLVNSRDVQESLLKILEDGVFVISWNENSYEFDTSKLLVVAMGSFSRINLDNKIVGFEKHSQQKKYNDLTREDFIENGIIPEFIGRFPVMVQMNELSYENLLTILDKAKNGALILNKFFFEKKGIKLTLADKAKATIAREASKAKYGARSLDEIIDRSLSVATFEIAQNPDLYQELLITEETIKDNKNYKLIKKKQ